MDSDQAHSQPQFTVFTFVKPPTSGLSSNDGLMCPSQTCWHWLFVLMHFYPVLWSDCRLHQQFFFFFYICECPCLCGCFRTDISSMGWFSVHETSPILIKRKISVKIFEFFFFWIWLGLICGKMSVNVGRDARFLLCARPVLSMILEAGGV